MGWFLTNPIETNIHNSTMQFFYSKRSTNSDKVEGYIQGTKLVMVSYANDININQGHRERQIKKLRNKARKDRPCDVNAHPISGVNERE